MLALRKYVVVTQEVVQEAVLVKSFISVHSCGRL